MYKSGFGSEIEALNPLVPQLREDIVSPDIHHIPNASFSDLSKILNELGKRFLKADPLLFYFECTRGIPDEPQRYRRRAIRRAFSASSCSSSSLAFISILVSGYALNELSSRDDRFSTYGEKKN